MKQFYKPVKIMAMLLASAALLIVTGFQSSAREDRSIFQNAFNSIENKGEVFKPGNKWFPYPEYEDRNAWDVLTRYHRKYIINIGNKNFNHEWMPTYAHDYLEFEKDGNRRHLNAHRTNNAVLNSFILAELAEGKGRFIPKIIDGLYFYAGRHSWSYAVHTSRQKSHRTLPIPQERIISLGSASTSETVAVALYFFHDAFEKIDPAINSIVLNALEKNIFEPYLDSSKDPNHGWLGTKRKEGGMVNNWNTYCNTQVILSFLLCEPDPDKLLRAVEKSVWSLDQYMDYVNLDGACEEGPSYWGMAGAKAYEFAKVMYYATDGKIDVMHDDQIRRMGEYKAKSYIGDGWVVNFGDGGARQAGDADLLWRIGNDTGSKQLMDFALYLKANRAKKAWFNSISPRGELFRSLELLRYDQDLHDYEAACLEKYDKSYDLAFSHLMDSVTSEWYDGTEFAALRTTSSYLGAKGGHNGESHNHNDCGSGVFFLDDCPVLIDLGSGTYGKDTFGKKRYTLYNTMSCWHNTPSINGVLQHEGKTFTTVNSTCDTQKNTFSTDIAGCYTEDAACKSWVRSFALTKKALNIKDHFSLEKRVAPDVINFVTPAEVFLPGDKFRGKKVKKGQVIILTHKFKDEKSECTVVLKFSPTLTAALDVLELKDATHKKVWGNRVNRITLTSDANAPVDGTYEYSFTKVK